MLYPCPESSSAFLFTVLFPSNTLPELDASTPAIPDGWTEEAFVQWLQGECPEEWTESQWDELRNQHSSLLADPENTTDEILF